MRRTEKEIFPPTRYFVEAKRAEPPRIKRISSDAEWEKSIRLDIFPHFVFTRRKSWGGMFSAIVITLSVGR